MITLYGSFPAFDLPQSSPFVMKAEVQLKMAGIPYGLERGTPGDGPKGKIPWIVEADLKIGDSTFIRAYIEKAHGVDLDRGLTPEMRTAPPDCPVPACSEPFLVTIGFGCVCIERSPLEIRPPLFGSEGP